MKNIFVLVLLILTSVSFAQKMGPKITAPEPKFDFGNILEGQRVSHEFVVQNDGDEVLEIRKINASCGCTAARPDKDRLAPGESTKIKVHFDSSNREGKQVKYVYVMTNDKANPQIRLEFTAFIEERGVSDTKSINSGRLIITPTKYDFGTIKEGSVVSVNIFMKNVGKENVEIKSINNSCDCITYDLSSKIIKPNENAVMKIILDTKNRSGKFTRTVTISATDSVEPNQVLVFFANIISKD